MATGYSTAARSRAHHFRAAALMPDGEGFTNGPALGALGYLCARHGQFIEAEAHLSVEPLAQAEFNTPQACFSLTKLKPIYWIPIERIKPPLTHLIASSLSLGALHSPRWFKNVIYTQLKRR